MSDDPDAYYNTWVSTFSRPDRKLLCSWHVDRSWQRKLNEHLKDKEQMAEVYAALKSLQNELSETSFRRSLQHFMAWIKGKSKPLAKYFEKEYVGRTREWAACFWVGSRANTNMFVEGFHRMLKEVYLEKKQNRHVDHLIFKLWKISRDKAFEQLIKAEKGKNTVRQRESTKRHKQGESVKKEAVHNQDENFWNVQSASNKQTVHHVRRISSGCSCLHVKLTFL